MTMRSLAELVADHEQTELEALRRRCAELLEFNQKLSSNLSAALETARSQADYIEELCAAGWDVLPTLELYWKGERPIPEWHPTAALRAVLEENK